MVRQLVNDTYLNPCSSLKGCLRPPGQRVTSRQLNNIKRVRKTLELISIYTPCTVKPAGQRKIPSKPREPWRSGGVFEPTPLLNWESKKIQAPSKSFASTNRARTHKPTISKSTSTPTTSKSSSTPTTSKSTFPSTTKRFRSTERKSSISAPALAMNYCKPTKKLSTNTTKFICPSEKKVYSSIPAPKLTEHPPKTSKHLTNTTKVIRSSEKNISPSVPARGLIPHPSTVNKPANKTTKLEHNTTRSIRSSTTKMNFNPPATLNNNHLPVGNKFSLTKTSPVTRNQIKTVQSSASNRTTTRGPRQSYHQQPATKLSTHTPLTLRTSMKTNLISTRKIASQTGPQIQHCLQTTRTPYQLFIGDSRLYHSSMKNTTSTSRRSKPATLPRKSIASKPPFMF